MTFRQIFQRIVVALEDAKIPYMLTGSFASSYHGTPRATQDIDLVVAPTPERVRRFVSSLPRSEYYVDEEAALEACAQESRFNVVDLDSGWKIDLIVRRARPFSRTEFDRRIAVDMEGMRLYVATAEDIVIAKLEWAKRGESRRQIEDAAGILRIRRGELDLPYIHRWVEELRLEDQWNLARGE